MPGISPFVGGSRGAQREQPRRHRALHSHATAAHHLQSGHINIGEIGIMDRRVIQRITRCCNEEAEAEDLIPTVSILHWS